MMASRFSGRSFARFSAAFKKRGVVLYVLRPQLLEHVSATGIYGGDKDFDFRYMAALSIPVREGGDHLWAVAVVLIFSQKVNSQFRDFLIRFLHVHAAAESVAVPQENQVSQCGRVL